VSDRGGGALGPFLLGVAVGAALGALFAPDAGEVTRGQLRKKLRGLRDLAEDKAGEIAELVAGDDDAGDDDEPEQVPEPRSARAELEQRLADARRRRRQSKRARDPEEEDEPVA
jgi:gas vesicle protein